MSARRQICRALVNPVRAIKLGAHHSRCLATLPLLTPPALRTNYARVMQRVGSDARFSSSATGSSTVVADGTHVHLSFELKNDASGEVIDSSKGKGLMSFVCGSGQIFPALDSGVKGMAKGETRGLSLGGDAGFGDRDEAIARELIDLEHLPDGVRVGSQIEVKGNNGAPTKIATVVELTGDNAVLDLNHPLAGKQLTMHVTLESSEEPTPEEPEKNAEGKTELFELVVEIDEAGDGKTYPKKGDKLTMHYTGKLAESGMVFDSSRSIGQPIEFEIGAGQVIKGWDIGIMKLSLGECATLRIPSAMAYGKRGSPPKIPPNTDLVFEVELLAIN